MLIRTIFALKLIIEAKNGLKGGYFDKGDEAHIGRVEFSRGASG
jgi:hypothetical protein